MKVFSRRADSLPMPPGDYPEVKAARDALAAATAELERRKAAREKMLRLYAERDARLGQAVFERILSGDEMRGEDIEPLAGGSPSVPTKPIEEAEVAVAKAQAEYQAALDAALARFKDEIKPALFAKLDALGAALKATVDANGELDALLSYAERQGWVPPNPRYEILAPLPAKSADEVAGMVEGRKALFLPKPGQLADGMIPVRMLVDYERWGAGELAGFDAAKARDLVLDGIVGRCQVGAGRSGVAG